MPSKGRGRDPGRRKKRVVLRNQENGAQSQATALCNSESVRTCIVSYDKIVKLRGAWSSILCLRAMAACRSQHGDGKQRKFSHHKNKNADLLQVSHSVLIPACP